MKKEDLFAMIDKKRQQDYDLDNDSDRKPRKRKKSWRLGLSAEEQLFAIMDASDSEGSINKETVK